MCGHLARRWRTGFASSIARLTRPLNLLIGPDDEAMADITRAEKGFDSPSADEKGNGAALTPFETEDPRERRYLIQKPTPLQYFFRGKLYRQSEKERVGGRFELFFDLLCEYFVARRCVFQDSKAD